VVIIPEHLFVARRHAAAGRRRSAGL